jgi:small-conductance mechanosensitive channel
METLQRVFTHILGFAQQPWFSIGETQIDALRLAGLILILLIVWWGGLLFEKTITRVGHDKKTHVNPSWYALSRIGRYAIWIIGFAIGLSYLGFNMASFSLIGGAIGVGVGFGLQNIISNFISGIIILVERIVKVNDFVD